MKDRSGEALYIETSALLNGVLEGNASLRELIVGAPTPVASRPTFLEARRALRRAELNRRLNASQKARLLRAVSEVESRCRIMAIDDSVWARAEETFPVEHVATLDAIHLAAVLVYQREVGPVVLASCDGKLRANAQALGVEVLPLTP